MISQDYLDRIQSLVDSFVTEINELDLEDVQTREDVYIYVLDVITGLREHSVMLHEEFKEFLHSEVKRKLKEIELRSNNKLEDNT